MDCQFCKDNVQDFDKPRSAHLVIHRDNDGHVHVHGDIDKKDIIKDMLEVAADEIGVQPSPDPGQNIPSEVIFHNKQRIGDMLVFTCAIRDFKTAFPKTRVNVLSTAPHIWDHNPHIDRTLEEFYSDDLRQRAKDAGKKPIDILTIADFPKHTNVVKIGPGWLTNKSNSIDWHFTNAYRISIEQALKIHIPQGESRPDIYLTQEEYDAPRVIDKPYWIICVSGEKGWGCKMYPFVKWQEFVSQNPHITFVQIGAAEDNPPRLQGSNVIDYVGKTQNKLTGIRDLFKLFLNAEGSIGLVSFHMHLSGALSKPCIVVAGAREPVAFTRYPGHAYLSTDGMLPCATKACWHCAITSCTNLVTKPDHSGNPESIPRCVDMITPDDLSRALEQFYIGGRLAFEKPSEKQKFKNVVKFSSHFVAPAYDKPDKPKHLGPSPAVEVNTRGLPWGKGALLEEDWYFIRQIMEKYNVKSVIEFGCGLSTLLFKDTGVELISFETQLRWIKIVKGYENKVNIQQWDGHSTYVKLKDKYDLAFVDGPAGAENREDAMRIAAQHAKIVIVHDGNMPIEKEFMKRQIEPTHILYGKGGRRCYLFVNESLLEKSEQEQASRFADALAKTGSLEIAYEAADGNSFVSISKKKSIKIVTTARGWGGQARSITTIMRLLIKAGHKVEFIPFRNAIGSKELSNMILTDPLLSQVSITLNYDTVKEHCDVLFMYADDFIWEFGNPQIREAFSNIGAERKIMMLNYRRGPVGVQEWTKGWDKYMFLNSGQEQELRSILPGITTKVLPPCTDLTPFFKVTPRDVPEGCVGEIHIVRHSSQGDTKFHKEVGTHIKKLTHNDLLLPQMPVSIDMLPGPSFVDEIPGFFYKHQRTPHPEVIAEFLSKGNLFWYSLPPGYMDMGPRVIMEAMAAGLPVVADNWGGAKDRVSRETGWLCDTVDEQIAIIKNMSYRELKQKGRAAREHAFKNFVPERWIDEIVN